MPGGWSWWGDDDDDPKAAREAENSGRQARRVVELIREAVGQPEDFAVTPQLLCDLNELAVAGLVPNPGMLRQRDLTITHSMHEPPPWAEVPGLVDELCDFVMQSELEAVERAAYVLWRVNWIHPFEDGNGRTARAASYLVLSVALGKELPGEISLVERLVLHKRQYNAALEAADRAWKQGRLDVSEMTALLRTLLEAQILNE